MSYTPKYQCFVYDQERKYGLAWKGRASEARAEKFRVALNKSFQPGGSNDHIRLRNGGIPHVHRVDIVTNDRYYNVVATASMPMFEVV